MWEVFFALSQQLVRYLQIVVGNAVAKLIFELLFLLANLLQVFDVKPVGHLDVALIPLFEVHSEP